MNYKQGTRDKAKAEINKLIEEISNTESLIALRQRQQSRLKMMQRRWNAEIDYASEHEDSPSLLLDLVKEKNGLSRLDILLKSREIKTFLENNKKP